jgi:hypothetical protein
MKLNGKVLVAVAMVVGAMATTGCKSGEQASEAVAPEENVATAPVDTAAPGVEQDSLRLSFYAPIAPPAIRVEERGRAPSERHFWVPGYHRWNGREHVWYNGRWEQRREGYEYVGPRWQPHRTHHWQYMPGHWVRR